jgi:hypothetical protein
MLQQYLIEADITTLSVADGGRLGFFTVLVPFRSSSSPKHDASCKCVRDYLASAGSPEPSYIRIIKVLNIED